MRTRRPRCSRRAICATSSATPRCWARRKTATSAPAPITWWSRCCSTGPRPSCTRSASIMTSFAASAMRSSSPNGAASMTIFWSTTRCACRCEIEERAARRRQKMPCRYREGNAMKRLRRRRFLQLAGAAAAAPALPHVATAAVDYPTRPVKILSGFAAGGAVDIVSRLMGEWLSERFGKQVFVEDRPGAANNIATELMVRSPPDGYTLLLTNPTNAINATLYPDLKFNFLKDSDAVAGIMRVPNVMTVGAQVPAKTIQEFIAYANANPGKV